MLAMGAACLGACGLDRGATQEPGLVPVEIEVALEEAAPRLSDEVTVVVDLTAQGETLRDVSVELQPTPGLRLEEASFARIDSLPSGTAKTLRTQAVLDEPGQQELSVVVMPGDDEGRLPAIQTLYVLVYADGVYTGYTYIDARRDSVHALFERGLLSREAYERALEDLVTGRAETEVIRSPAEP